MGSMAVHAGALRGVLRNHHPGEARRLGAVRLVAHEADAARIGPNRLLGGRILGVTGERAVAGLASHPRVLARAKKVGFLGMAVGASRPPGIDEGSLAVGFQGGHAKVAVNAEARGNEEGTEDQEHREAPGKQQGHSNQVLTIPQRPPHPGLPQGGIVRFGASPPKDAFGPFP